MHNNVEVYHKKIIIFSKPLLKVETKTKKSKFDTKVNQYVNIQKCVPEYVIKIQILKAK